MFQNHKRLVVSGIVDVSSNYPNHYLVNVRYDNFHILFPFPYTSLVVLSFANELRIWVCIHRNIYLTSFIHVEMRRERKNLLTQIFSLFHPSTLFASSRAISPLWQPPLPRRMLKVQLMCHKSNRRESKACQTFQKSNFVRFAFCR